MDRENIISTFEKIISVCKEDGCDFVDLSFEDAEQILAMLKEREIRELTMDEWRKWKENPKRNPICMLWENDTSPMWILNPNDVHEPALLMGKLKLFTGKPTFEQCKGAWRY